MGPFKDELKLIKGWQTRVQLVWLLSWKMQKLWQSIFDLIEPFETFALTDIIWYQLYVTFTLTMSLSHMSPMWEVLGNLTTGNSWSWCLFQVSQLRYTAAQTFEMFEFTFLTRGSTWPSLWLGGKCQVWGASNAMKNMLESMWFIVITCPVMGTTATTGYPMHWTIPNQNHRYGIRTVNWFQLHLGEEFSEYQTWKNEFWWRVHLRTIMKPSTSLTETK